MQTVTIKSVERNANNDWEYKGTPMYSFDVYIEESSEVHRYSAQSPDNPKLQVGKSEVVITPGTGNYPPNIKPAPKGNNFSSGAKKTDPKSFAASYSKDITIAFINQGTIKDSKTAVETIDAFYNIFLNLMK